MVGRGYQPSQRILLRRSSKTVIFLFSGQADTFSKSCHRPG
jgi:hypothetical protein